jgi:hypothetical protein
MENKTIFKVGDKVYHYNLKWGTIMNIVSDDKYPILVKFGTDIFCFTNYGSEVDDSMPYLSFTEYDFVNGGFSQERPIEVPKMGAICWVRNQEKDPWLIRHFLRMKENYYVASSNINTSNINTSNSATWNYLTTQNPYENEI